MNRLSGIVSKPHGMLERSELMNTDNEQLRFQKIPTTMVGANPEAASGEPPIPTNLFLPNDSFRAGGAPLCRVTDVTCRSHLLISRLIMHRQTVMGKLRAKLDFRRKGKSREEGRRWRPGRHERGRGRSFQMGRE